MFEIIGMVLFTVFVFMFLFIILGAIAAAIDSVTGAISNPKGRGK